MSTAQLPLCFTTLVFDTFFLSLSYTRPRKQDC